MQKTNRMGQIRKERDRGSNMIRKQEKAALLKARVQEVIAELGTLRDRTALVVTEAAMPLKEENEAGHGPGTSCLATTEMSRGQHLYSLRRSQPVRMKRPLSQPRRSLRFRDIQVGTLCGRLRRPWQNQRQMVFGHRLLRHCS